MANNQASGIDNLRAAAESVDGLSKVKLGRLLNIAARLVREEQSRIAGELVHHDLSTEFRLAAISIDNLSSAEAAEKLRRAAEILDMLNTLVGPRQ